MPDPTSPHFDSLTQAVVHALQRAKEKLLARMALVGLTPEAGWRVKEELRHTSKGTEWILSPIHLREMPPELEERVRIEADGSLVDGGLAE